MNKNSILYKNNSFDKYIKTDHIQYTLEKFVLYAENVQSPLESPENLYKQIINYMKQGNVKKKYFGVFVYNQQKISQYIFKVQGKNTEWKGQKAILLSFFEISQTLRLERQTIESKYKTIFIRSFSHEIRHPVNNIMSTLDQFQTQLQNEQDVQQLAQKIKECLHTVQLETEYLLNISNQMSDVIEIQSNTFQLQPVYFRIKELADQSLSFVRYSAQRKNIDLRINIEEIIPEFICADKQRIKQVLQNLLTNALKYTKSGFIELNFKHQELLSDYNEQSNSYNDKQLNLIIQVKDTGVGISQEKQIGLFDIFGQIQQQNYDIKKPQGVGLGLYLSQLLAVKLGGRPIHVISFPGQGSDFSFQVNYDPLGQDQLSSKIMDSNILSLLDLEHLNDQSFIDSLKQVPCSNPNINKVCDCPQILLVDDSEIIRQGLEMILGDYRKEEAKDGCEALEMVKQRMSNSCCKYYQLIITDCEMPFKDGWEFTQQVRKLGYQWPILGYTAYSSANDIEYCIQCGMDQVLAKPSKKEIILESIKYLIDKAFLEKLQDTSQIQVSSQEFMNNLGKVEENKRRLSRQQEKIIQLDQSPTNCSVVALDYQLKKTMSYVKNDFQAEDSPQLKDPQ